MMPYTNRLNFNNRYPEALPPDLQFQQQQALPPDLQFHQQQAYQIGTNLPGSIHKGPNPGPNRNRYSNDFHENASPRDTPYPSPPNRVCFHQQPPKSIPNPARTRRPFVNTQCPACGKVGHTMQTCDMLAMAISLKRYMRHQVSAKMMSKIETEWLSKHQERLQQIDARTPRQVLRAFADGNDLTVADIDSQIDWNTWEYNSVTNLTTDTPTTNTETNNNE
jgi:hypothetical protein